MQLQQFIVMERIDDLHREAELLRTERRMRHRYRGADGSGIEPVAASGAGRRPARVRLGHWLIAVGIAVSGSASDKHGGTAGHAA